MVLLPLWKIAFTSGLQYEDTQYRREKGTNPLDNRRILPQMEGEENRTRYSIHTSDFVTMVLVTISASHTPSNFSTSQAFSFLLTAIGLTHS
jgi:hypothetical protein